MNQQTAPHDPETGEIREGDIETAVRRAQAQLQQAAGAGAFARDPYRLVLAALHATLGTFIPLVRRIETHQFSPAERAALRRDTAIATRSGVAEGTSEALAAVAAAAKAKDRRTYAWASGGVLALLAATGMGCFWMGRYSAQTELIGWATAERAEIALAQQRVSLPLPEARVWALLIQANPAIREAVSKAQDVGRDAAGRPHGRVPLWLDVQRAAP